MWDGSTIPPVITSETPGTWAHDTVSRRLREDILARVFRDNADVLAAGTDAEVNLRALDAELEEEDEDLEDERRDNEGRYHD